MYYKINLKNLNLLIKITMQQKWLNKEKDEADYFLMVTV